MRTSSLIVSGQPDDPVAVILPGTGSSADFVTRAFGPALAREGYALVTADPRPGPSVVDAAFETLDEAVRRHRVTLVGGVSLGAHVALRWAARQPPGGAGLAGLLLALPAWTGGPGPAAAASTYAAAHIRQAGLAAALAEARAHAVPWVADELAAAWPRYGAALPETLDAAAGSAGPGAAELARVDLPVGIAAFGDDPLHPLPVAREWARLLRRAALEQLSLDDCADHHPAGGPGRTAGAPGGGTAQAGRGALGRSTLRAWRRARAGCPPPTAEG